MTGPKYVTLPTAEKRQEAIDAYTRAVGRVSGAWNYLHGTLGELFAVVIGGDAELVIAKCRSLANDRAQRKKLRAAINAASPERWKETPKARADLLCVLERADELSIVRNDAIHAPVMLHIGAEIVEVNVALHTIGKREKKLLDNLMKGRKLLDEFTKCEQDADALSRFVRRATAVLAEPDRYEWPTLPPKQI